MTWGVFRIQKQGNVKWSTLATGAAYWGQGYDDTQEQAKAKADAALAKRRAADPKSVYRVTESTPNAKK